MQTKHNDERRAKASGILSKHGYGKMADMAKTAVHEHEAHMHKGKKETRINLATGGCAMGGESKARLDRKPRAAGGRNKAHKEPKVAVNVINAGGKQTPPAPMQGGPAPAMRPPMPPMAPQSPAQGAAPAPMGARPPMGAPPPGMPGPRPFKNGGPVKNKTIDIPHLEGGSGGGLGRLEKAEHEGKRKAHTSA